MRKSRDTRMLSVAKAGRLQRQVQVCIDKRTDKNITTARAKYEAILGREVSTSMVVRRGLDLLARYLENLHGDEWQKDELAALTRSIR